MYVCTANILFYISFVVCCPSAAPSAAPPSITLSTTLSGPAIGGISVSVIILIIYLSFCMGSIYCVVKLLEIDCSNEGTYIRMYMCIYIYV